MYVIDSIISTFGDDEFKIVDALRALGFPRYVAYTLVALLDRTPKTSRQISQASGLRQPEVSKAIGAIRPWLEIRHDRGTRRPVDVYRLAKSLRTIMDERLEAKSKEHLEIVRVVKGVGMA